jgi:hypothetical protein
MDSAQEKLHDALERSDELTSHCLLNANGNENDGRALIELLRGHRAALVFIENRLKDIQDEIITRETASFKVLKEIEVMVFVLTLIAIAASFKLFT